MQGSEILDHPIFCWSTSFLARFLANIVMAHASDYKCETIEVVVQKK